MNEKEAIETYKNFLDDISKNGGCTIDIDFQHKKEYEAMWEILNFIEKCKSNVNVKNERLLEYAIELEKKDAIIEEMAREFYKRLNISKRCYLQTSIEKCLKHKNCIDCLKQYFNQKIEKGE